MWPGLAQAWLMGRWEGLAVAVAFALAINTALVTTWVWPEWPVARLPSGMLAVIAWVWVSAMWLGGMAWVRRDWPRLQTQAAGDIDQESEVWFSEAQREYLKGHWIEAETLVGRLLAKDRGDVEARLLLASIQRRTQRRNDARKTLLELRDLEGASRWRAEIQVELRQLEELEEERRERGEAVGRKRAQAA